MDSNDPSSKVRLALALALVKARAKSSDVALASVLEAKAELLKNEVALLGQKVKEAEEDVKEIIFQVPSKRQCCQDYNEPNGLTTNIAATYKHPVTNNALRYILRCDSSTDRNQKISAATDFVFELIGESKHGAQSQCSQGFLFQSLEFIKDSVALLLQDSNGVIFAEKITKRLIILTTAMVLGSRNPKDLDGSTILDRASHQHMLYQLSYVPFIGQRLLLATSRQIAIVSEMVFHADPYEDEKVTNTYENVYFMLHLVEVLCIEHVSTWATSNQLDFSLLEDWVQCFFQMKENQLKVLGSWSLLFISYTDQIAGEIFKQLHRLSSLEEHFQDTFHKQVLNMLKRKCCHE